MTVPHYFTPSQSKRSRWTICDCYTALNSDAYNVGLHQPMHGAMFCITVWQGAGKVDDSLDRTKAEAVKVEAKPTKPMLPPRLAGKGKGKR